MHIINITVPRYSTKVINVFFVVVVLSKCRFTNNCQRRFWPFPIWSFRLLCNIGSMPCGKISKVLLNLFRCYFIKCNSYWNGINVTSIEFDLQFMALSVFFLSFFFSSFNFKRIRFASWHIFMTSIHSFSSGSWESFQIAQWLCYHIIAKCNYRHK